MGEYLCFDPALFHFFYSDPAFLDLDHAYFVNAHYDFCHDRQRFYLVVLLLALFGLDHAYFENAHYDF
jgi:hypothetical protein